MMENFKFETLVTADTQLGRLEECVRTIPAIKDWEIIKYLNGIILSVEAANISAFEIVLTLKNAGFSLTRLYEE